MISKKLYPNLGFGMGLRTDHYPHILSKWPKIDWFEIISENFMDTDGRPRRVLERILEHYPVVMHGVSLSIGTTDPDNSDYLKKLKKLADLINTPWVSDHLCWTGVAHKNTHDLLPVPYTEEALTHIVNRIKRVQDFLERPLILENPSTYLEFNDSQMEEWEFIARMAEEADCGILLDANNIYVTCYNHRKDPKEYIDAIPTERIAQIHLAGHENCGTHIIDTHDGHVIDEVWALYNYIISRTGPVSTMVEWDADIPEFDVVKTEVEKAQNFTMKPEKINDLPNFFEKDEENKNYKSRDYEKSLKVMQESIILGNDSKERAEKWIKSKSDFPSKDQLKVYINGYRIRLAEFLNDEMPVLRHFLGGDEMDKLVNAYIEKQKSTHFNICKYIKNFPAFVKKEGKELLKGKNVEIAHEIALLEEKLSEVFDMQESSPLDKESFSSISPENLLNQIFAPRAALFSLLFEYKINDYYQDVKNDKNPAQVIKEKTYLIVFRHEDRVLRLEMDKSEYELFTLLSGGNALETAIGKLLRRGNHLTDVELKNWFSRWVGNGLFAQAA